MNTHFQPLKRFVYAGLMSALILLGGAASARANSWTFSAVGTSDPDGHPLSASATFVTSGNVLTITLTNTYSSYIHAGGQDVLNDLFFNLHGGATLSVVSASLGVGSVMLPNSTDPALLGSAWGYSAIGGTTGNAFVPPAGDSVISSTGFTTGTFTNFNGNAITTGTLAGPNYGILGNATDTYGGFSPLVANSVVFTFNYTGNITSVDGIVFGYGTASSDWAALTPSVPDGGTTAMMLGVGLVGLAGLSRKLNRKR